jgi:adenylate cyclase class 2
MEPFLEVEAKFPIPSVSDTERSLRDLGAELTDVCQEIDTYFAHPCRDFAQTDEALRIRQAGERVTVTYKGPKLDPQTKTRQEIELRLEFGTSAASVQLFFEQLGFRVVRPVVKERKRYCLFWQGFPMLALVDKVEELGEFLELETKVPAQQFEQAKRAVLGLATRLGLGESQRRSYLELLLEMERARDPNGQKATQEGWEGTMER